MAVSEFTSIGEKHAEISRDTELNMADHVFKNFINSEEATAALDVFSEWKSIYVDFSGGLQRARIDIQ
jgi:hypothetical protein